MWSIAAAAYTGLGCALIWPLPLHFADILAVRSATS
jgi:hypothetical protein